MKNRIKRALSLLTALALVLALFPVSEAEAADQPAVTIAGFLAAVEELKQEFPDGYYWNHLVQYGLDGDTLLAARNNAYAYSVTNTPCATHSGRAVNGQYDCNFAFGGLQCWGFACMLFYKLYGVECSTLERKYDVDGVSVGDYVRMGTDQNGHSFLVTGKNGSVVTVAECNFGYAATDRCRIKWGRQVDLKAGDYGLAFGYYYHAPNNDASNTTPSSANTQPSINFGTDFYAYIGYAYNDNSTLYLKNDGSDEAGYGKVTTAMRNDLYDSRFIWHCVKNGNSYRLTNEFDGRLLDVYCGKDEDCTPIGLWPRNSENEKAPQSWRFYQLPGLPASTFCMMPDSSASRIRVADISNGSTVPGGALQLYSQNHTAAQKFSLYKLSSRGIQYAKPAKPGAPQSISTNSGNSGTTISWSSVHPVSSFDKRAYEVIVDGISYTTKSTSISLQLSAGSHSVKVCAVNTNYADYKSGYTSKTVSVAGTSKKTISVTITASPVSGGIVSGGGTYQEGDLITVTATPYFGYVFKEWQQNGSFVCNNPDFSFTTSMNQNLVAVFEKLPDDYVVTGWIPEPL